VLEDLYKSCHFLFLPSRAEAFGCVFCEASSFGMPSLSRRTGGVPTAIKQGMNGFILDTNASVSDYVDIIINNFLDKTRYKQLSVSSFLEYKNRLNWQVAGDSLTSYIRQL
jgi:glycosyltransferase involved in cell wall biosynthesis